jgi:hypothetical protein
LVAGGVDGVGGPVVLAGLPDDGVVVVLAAVVDGHPHAQGQGGLPVADRLVAEDAALVGREAVVGVEPVEDAFGVAPEPGVGVAEFVGEAGVVVVVAGVKVAAEAVGGRVGAGSRLVGCAADSPGLASTSLTVASLHSYA